MNPALFPENGGLWKRGALATFVLFFVLAGGSWIGFSAAAPEAQSEFVDIFGSENLGAAGDLKIVKPLFMRGYFMSFRMKPSEFNSRLVLQFGRSYPVAANFLRGQRLPDGWPDKLAAIDSFRAKISGEKNVRVVYDEDNGVVYVSVGRAGAVGPI